MHILRRGLEDVLQDELHELTCNLGLISVGDDWGLSLEVIGESHLREAMT